MSNRIKIEAISQLYKVTNGTVDVFVHLHDGYIEIVKAGLGQKEYVFKGQDTAKKRELWLNVLKTIEAAVRLVPDQKSKK
jgi:hypothetical protein